VFPLLHVHFLTIPSLFSNKGNSIILFVSDYSQYAMFKFCILSVKLTFLYKFVAPQNKKSLMTVPQPGIQTKYTLQKNVKFVFIEFVYGQ